MLVINMNEEPSSQNVRAVTRALAVLVSFVGKKQQSLAEVTSATGLDKGTTRRLLLTLMASGFIVQDEVSQHYRLGRVIRQLAAGIPDSLDLRSAALPVMTSLSSDLSVTSFISAYRDGDVICLERIHDMKGIEVHWWSIGSSLPFNVGAAPKLLLAYQPPAEIERVLKRKPEKLTPKSETDVGKIRQQLAEIRKRDYEFAIDDVALGLSALAVPVRSPEGEVIGSISIAGLTPQMVKRGRPAHLKRLREAAAMIELRLARGG